MQTNKTTAVTLKNLLISLCLLLAPALAVADDCSDPSKNSTDSTCLSNKLPPSPPCEDPNNCLASGYSQPLNYLLFRPTYQQALTMASGGILQKILFPMLPPATMPTGDTPTSTSVQTILSNSGNTADTYFDNMPTFFAPNLVLPPKSKLGISGIGLPSFVSSMVNFNVNRTASPADKQSAINSLNFDAFIAPVNLQPVTKSNAQAGSNQPTDAETFITYATGLINPMQTADFSKLATSITDPTTNVLTHLSAFQKNPEIRSYLASLRTYAAQLSVGISNLYYLYNERMPIQDGDAQNKAMALIAANSPANPLAGKLPQAAQSVSPLEVLQLMATRRVNDPNWYTTMQNALPSTLMRESLFLLAEIPPLLVQLHLDLERILATLSIMQIQQVSGGRILLDQQRQQVDNLIKNPPGASQSSDTQKAAEQAASQVSESQLDEAKKALKEAEKNQ